MPASNTGSIGIERVNSLYDIIKRDERGLVVQGTKTVEAVPYKTSPPRDSYLK